MKLLKIALELVLLVIGSMFGTQATKISFTLLPGDETSKMIYTKANKDSGTAYVSIQPPKVPVLLYHYVKKSLAKGTLHSVPRDTFYQQIKMLHDSGYQTISPDELYSSFTTGSVLPPKPIILTFDDTHEEHYFIVAPILAEFVYKAVFFITTGVIGKPGYMTAEQLKELSDSGHVIGAHTWTHPNMDQIKDRELIWQVDKPKQELEKITGKPVQHFAYPTGVWNDAAIFKLKRHGVKTAFQLSEKQSGKNPLHTFPRILVSGLWSPAQLFKAINCSG